MDLDHVAHFVPDIDRASADLERLGFCLTPFSAQSHRTAADAAVVPAGAGNRCVMLESGYLEFLTPTADTPLAAQLRTAIERYTGVHLIAFGTDAPDADHARLAAAGFGPLAPVALERPIETPAGMARARFTVVRVPPGTMSEGRIQFCQHHTREAVWQKRWLAHPNGATALAAVLVCVADPLEAAQRYGRFTGIAAIRRGNTWRLETARGAVLFATPELYSDALGLVAPALPWIAGYVLETRDPEATRACLARGGFAPNVSGPAHFSVALPPSLGGAIVWVRSGQTFQLSSTIR